MDRFRTIRLLGAGGVAEVWLAFDRRRREQVALKILRAQYAQDEGLLRRFRREAALITGLHSPYVVRVHGLEEEEGSPPILVMEYVPGADLKILLQLDGSMEPTYALTLLRQIATGVAVAHRAGLVHRDLKPANILMTPDGTPKITDFGIAHDTAGAGMTEPGQTWGTSAYLAPEQALGHPVTSATDIYSLGVILFEMLTGRVPFVGEDPVQVALAHIQQPTPSVHTLNPLIPPGIEQLVARMMAKEPTARPADGAALVAILDRYLEGGDTPTVLHDSTTLQNKRQGATPSPRSKIMPRRNRWGWMVALLALLLLGGGFAASQEWLGQNASPVEANTASETKGLAFVPTPTLTPTATPSPTPTPLPTRREGNGTDAIARQVTEPMLVDGNLGEWGRFPIVTIDNLTLGTERWGGPGDLSGTIAFAWDERYLYVAVDRRDEVHVQTTTGEALYRGDTVEVWLDVDVGGDYDTAEANQDDFQIVLSAGDFGTRRAEAYVAYPLPFNTNRNRLVQVRAAPLPNGYTLEAAIAWELLGISPTADFTVGYAVVLNDIDEPVITDLQSQLTTTPQSPFLKPQTFGNLHLALETE
jgi:serine/threonine protein kinase